MRWIRRGLDSRRVARLSGVATSVQSNSGEFAFWARSCVRQVRRRRVATARRPDDETPRAGATADGSGRLLPYKRRVSSNFRSWGCPSRRRRGLDGRDGASWAPETEKLRYGLLGSGEVFGGHGEMRAMDWSGNRSANPVKRGRERGRMITCSLGSGARELGVARTLPGML